MRRLASSTQAAPRSRQCLAPFFRRTRYHVCSLLALPVPAPTSIGITGGARPCPREVSTAQTARAASNPIVVADLRAGQGCADCVGEQYGTDGLTCQACEPGKHPHIDHTSCDDCSPVRPRQASAPDSPGNAPQIVALAAQGRAGDTGTCKKCKPGKMPAEDKQSCIKCGGPCPGHTARDCTAAPAPRRKQLPSGLAADE